MKKTIPILILFLAASCCFAIQEDKKISLQDAIKTALQTNPQIELAKLNTEISKNNILSAGRLQNPSLEFFQNIPKAGNGNPQTIGLDYTIEILKRRNRKNTARALSASAHDNQKFLEFLLIAEVKKSYIDFLVKKSNLKIVKEQEMLARDTYEEMKKEKLPEPEIIQAKIALNRAIMYSNIARKEVISAQNYFNSVLNTSDINYDTREDFFTGDYAALGAVPPEIMAAEFSKIKDYAIQNRFDLKKARNEIDAAIFMLSEVKSQKIPDLEIMGGYAYQTKGTSDDGHFQSGGYAGVNLVNLPVLHTFKPEIKNAEIEVEKAKLKYEDVKIDAIRNLTDAYEKYQISRENLLFYNKEMLAEFENLMTSSRKSLDKKEISLSTFLVSKRLYLEFILGYQEALGEYCTSFAELLREMNASSLDFENI